VSACRRFTRSTAALVIAGGLTSAAARAGLPSTYLVPSTYCAAVGQRLAVHVEAGDETGLRTAAWPTQDIAWLFVRAAGFQENRADVGPTEAGTDSIEVLLERTGVTLIALDTRAVEARVTARELRDFLRRTAARDASAADSSAPAPRPHGADALASVLAALPENDQLRVRRVASAKTLVRVGDPDSGPARPSAVAQSKTGQAAEIRPLADPTLVPVGSDLPVRAYVGGDKVSGLKVLATCAATGRTQEAVTEDSGACHFRIDSAGVWRVEFHHCVSGPETPGAAGIAPADWTIYSATLTFEVTNAGAGK